MGNMVSDNVFCHLKLTRDLLISISESGSDELDELLFAISQA